MKFLITGASGQLGYDINRLLILRGEKDVFCPSHSEMDITNYESVKKYFDKYKPNVVFHCAAYTMVDKAQEDNDACYKVNVVGTENIVKCARENNSKVIYISTDYVFDGTKDGIYLEDEKTNPINYYGETKLMGEESVKTLENYLIARISWVFGINGKNFIKTMLSLSKKTDTVSVVNDQIGSPTYTVDLSERLIDAVYKNLHGTYNITNTNFCTWEELARYIFEINNIKMNVKGITTKDYNALASRPLNSKLSKEKMVKDGLLEMPTWQDAVKRYCLELKKESD